MEQCGGGVARNMAEALWRLRGGRARLLTAVGDDADGRFLADIAPGLLLDGCIVHGARTPTYAAVLDRRGECLLGLGDMALHKRITTDMVDQHTGVLQQAPLVVVDGNIPQTTMQHVLQLCHHLKKPVFFEPTDRRKATIPLSNKHRITFASPNLAELRAMAHYLSPDLNIKAKTDLDEVLALSKIVLQVVDHLIVTLGAKGIITVGRKGNEKFVGRLYPVDIIDKVENVSGAGDCFASGYIHGILSGYKESNCVSIGFESAKGALLSRLTVPSQLKISCSKTEAKYKTLL